MIKPLFFLFFVLMSIGPILAVDSRPTVDSVKDLLNITGAKSISNEMSNQGIKSVEDLLKDIMKKELKDKTITPQIEALLKERFPPIVAAAKKYYNWEVQESIMLPFYIEGLTQDEVNGMLAFYRTPAGKALNKRVPIIVKDVAAESAKQGAIVNKAITSKFNEFLAELKTEIAKIPETPKAVEQVKVIKKESKAQESAVVPNAPEIKINSAPAI